LIACIGAIVQEATFALTDIKFHIVTEFMQDNKWGTAFFSFYAFCLFYALIAGGLCLIEPAGVGSGIPEIKAYLNGVNLNKTVRLRVLIIKASAVFTSSTIVADSISYYHLCHLLFIIFRTHTHTHR
jgi:chloride channel 7